MTQRFRRPGPWNWVDVGVVLAATAAVLLALWHLRAASHDIAVSRTRVDTAPVTIYRPADPRPGPVVLIAHGFAGSQQLMQSFALTYARAGYTAVTFDFPGHGRNPTPLGGSITDERGATQVLVDATRAVATFARGLGDGRLAVLGHSMASDIVVRFAEATPDVAATVAVSMFSPAVTATRPANLLVVTGEWEGSLRQEALRAIGLASAPEPAVVGRTYGDFAAGTARRTTISRHVEHASVLFSQDTMRESLDWLDRSFGVTRAGTPWLDDRGPWIMLLLAAVLALARPLARILPVVADPPTGAGLGWRRLAAPVVVPMVATPLILTAVPTHFLPILVGDYLAVHFALYGALTLFCTIAARPVRPAVPERIVWGGAWLGATVAVIAFAFLGLVWPIDSFVTSFMPGPERWALIAAMLVGTLSYFLADEWLTRGPGAGLLAYPASKLAFLASLGLAIALDLENLFFLIIIVPVIVLFFGLFGLMSGWIYRRTGHPLVAAVANAVIFAWAIGVTFPLLAA